MSGASLTWSAWPLRRRPGLGALGMLVVAGALSGTWGWTRSIPLVTLAAVILCIGVAPFFAPTRYLLDEQGVEVTRLGFSRRRPWTEFGPCRREPGAVWLVPARRRPWRGSGEMLFLEGNGDEVGAYVEAMVGRTAEGARP